MNPALRVFAVAVALLGRASASALPDASDELLSERCELFRADVVEDAALSACARCHDGKGASAGSNHPVGINYADAASRPRSRSRLRPLAQVVEKGVFLPDGQIRCVTCHDGRSPWRYGIAVPPTAEVVEASDMRSNPPRIGGARVAWRDPDAAVRDVGSMIMVDPRPLCIACHDLGG